MVSFQSTELDIGVFRSQLRRPTLILHYSLTLLTPPIGVPRNDERGQRLLLWTDRVRAAGGRPPSLPKWRGANTLVCGTSGVNVGKYVQELVYCHDPC